MDRRYHAVPSPEETADGFSRQQLSTITKALFACHIREAHEDTLRVAEDEAFEALRALASQQYRQLCSSSCTTQGINVRCTSVYVPQQQRGACVEGGVRVCARCVD